MTDLSVSIEINGTQVNVGSIRGKNTQDASFSYADDYLSSGKALPISISLPIQREAFSPQITKNFFEGLLPEGFTRKTLAGWLRTDEKDYLSILKALGKECIGAIKIDDADESVEESSYKKLSVAQLKELAGEGTESSADFVIKSRISLAGAFGKTGLYYDKNNNSWYLPKGAAPSTHIVKQSHIRLSDIVTNERLCMLTAKKLGITVAESFIINTGKGEDQDILFATERFDRIFKDSNETISGLQAPLRLHQEDFAQAMKIMAEDKYEKAGGEHFKKMIELLRFFSSSPIEDQLRLWDITVFNYLIGNTDGHIKNFALLYSTDLREKRLAPAYDIISTRIYKSASREMAFSIGGKYSIDDINAEDFAKEASKSGIGEKIAMKRFVEMSSHFSEALLEAAGELEDEGYIKAKEIAAAVLGS